MIDGKRPNRHDTRHMGFKCYQPFGNAGLFGKGNEIFATLVLLDFGSPLQQRFQAAIGVDEFGTCLDANARHARHIVRTITSQRLHIDHLVRCHTKFFQHLRLADHFLLGRIEEINTRTDQLHHVLV